MVDFLSKSRQDVEDLMKAAHRVCLQRGPQSITVYATEAGLTGSRRTIAIAGAMPQLIFVGEGRFRPKIREEGIR